MAFWYDPSELPQRVAVFHSVGQLSSALCGLLAYATSFMDGLGHVAGWRSLFLLEGFPAIQLLAVALFGLPDYPKTTRILTKQERIFIVQRLSSKAPSGDAGHWNFATTKTLFSDPTTYTFAIY